MHPKRNVVNRLLGYGDDTFMKPPSAVCYSDTLPVATSWRCAGGEDGCPPRVCVPECPGANDHHCQPGDLTACDKNTAEEPCTSLPLMLILRERLGQGSRKKRGSWTWPQFSPIENGRQFECSRPFNDNPPCCLCLSPLCSHLVTQENTVSQWYECTIMRTWMSSSMFVLTAEGSFVIPLKKENQQDDFIFCVTDCACQQINQNII